MDFRRVKLYSVVGVVSGSIAALGGYIEARNPCSSCASITPCICLRYSVSDIVGILGGIVAIASALVLLWAFTEPTTTNGVQPHDH